jgi:hypothetical protein
MTTIIIKARKPSPARGGRAIRRRKMLKLFGLEEIRKIRDSVQPIKGCLLVTVNRELMQVAFTTERPPDHEGLWKHFEYEYDPRDTACIPLFVQTPVYGVFLLGFVRWGLPLAILSPERDTNFGVASFRGGQYKAYLRAHKLAASTIFEKNRLTRLGNQLVVAFPDDSNKVEWAEAHGGKFFPDLKVWVFPAEVEGIKEVLLK